MPNGGHASPWSCPHTSDDEEISTEKIRFRYLGTRVVKRWKEFVARNKRARDLEEYLRAPRASDLRAPTRPPPTESESPNRHRLLTDPSRSRSPHGVRCRFINGTSIGPIFDLDWMISRLYDDIGNLAFLSSTLVARLWLIQALCTQRRSRSVGNGPSIEKDPVWEYL